METFDQYDARRFVQRFNILHDTVLLYFRLTQCEVPEISSAIPDGSLLTPLKAHPIHVPTVEVTSQRIPSLTD